MNKKKFIISVFVLLKAFTSSGQTTVVNDQILNWVKTTTYQPVVNANGDASNVAVSQSISYHDDAGKKLQSQLKNFTTNKVLVTHELYDKFNRNVGTSLPAPSTSISFAFDPSFLTNPNTTQGSARWYYSANNNLEPLTPKTSYPYTNSDYYQDGTGEPRKSATAGNEHYLGSGHEVVTGSFPIENELNDYVAKRSVVLSGIDGAVIVSSLKSQGLQSVTRDENGRYSISITDKSGKTLLTALGATPEEFQASPEKVLEIVNTISINNSNPSSFTYRRMVYFYLLTPQAIQFDVQTGFTIQDLISNATYSSIAAVPKDGDKWKPGFYRIYNVTGTLNFQFKNYFKNVAYQFYDLTGQLKYSLSPNGFTKWKLTNSNLNVDASQYAYNFEGLTVSRTEPDAGTIKYIYRKDNLIRFSQNAQQASNEANNITTSAIGKFAYTNYDVQGRPIESGVYNGPTLFSGLSNQIEYYDQVTYSQSQIADWVRTHYDYPDPNFSTITKLPLTQTFTRGGVSYSENADIKTWYSYDELGRVAWIAQKPTKLNYVFLSQYEYDFLGKVLQSINYTYNDQGNIVNQFYHHFNYDADQRLKQVFTSVDGTSKKLRATYNYYLHGPLKRIELGDDIQGMDFIYNINGWLTQINHPDLSSVRDPGGDSNDVFGMIIDYYETSLNGLYKVSSLNLQHDPKKRHGLSKETISSYANRNRLSDQISHLKK
jgi:hypothetical protein